MKFIFLLPLSALINRSRKTYVFCLIVHFAVYICKVCVRILNPGVHMGISFYMSFQNMYLEPVWGVGDVWRLWMIPNWFLMSMSDSFRFNLKTDFVSKVCPIENNTNLNSIFCLIKVQKLILFFHLHFTWLCGSWHHQRILKKYPFWKNDSWFSTEVSKFTSAEYP